MLLQHQPPPVVGYPVGTVASHGLQGSVAADTPVIPISVQLSKMGVDVGTLTPPTTAARASVYGQAVRLQKASQMQGMERGQPAVPNNAMYSGAASARSNAALSSPSAGTANSGLPDRCLCIAACFELLTSCV
jgi:hypothetical protein